LKKWIENLMDPEFLIKHSKTIGIVIVSGIITCLLMIFILQTNENLKEPIRKRSPELEKLIEKSKEKQQQLEEKQQNILRKNLTETFTFGDLEYKSPDIRTLKTSFLNTTDQIVGSHKDYILFKTVRDGLYFYNIKDGTKDYVTDLSIFHQLGNGYLYYVEIEDKMGNRLMRYNIETKEKEELEFLSFNQTISGIGGNDDVVYYIINEGGKSYLQAISLSEEIGKNIRNMNILLPTNSYLVQEGNNIYVINKNGQFIAKDDNLKKINTTPQIDYLDVKVWNGYPLIYGYNNDSQTTEIHYQNKVLIKSDFIFEMWPIDDKYLLVNDHNNLKIIDKDTLKSKVISQVASNSVVTGNGNIMFSISLELKEGNSSYYYYFEKKQQKSEK
jgi:hypothetical protein